MNPRIVQTGDPAHLKAAFSMLGLSEIEGARHEKKILAMYAASGHPEIRDDETPWCAAFVGWCLQRASLPGTNSLMARSYSKYGRRVDPDSKVPRGAIAVWPRAGSPGSGHVNFVLSDDGTYVWCIGGNQANDKGGGVTVSKYRKSGAVAFRVPAGSVDEAAPKPTPKPTPKVTPEVTKPAEPETKPLAKSTTVWASIMAAITTVVSATVELLGDWRTWAAVVVVALLVYVIWERNGKPDIRGWFRSPSDD